MSKKKSKKNPYEAARRYLSLSKEERQTAVESYIKNIDKYEPHLNRYLKYEEKYGTGFNFEVFLDHNKKIDPLYGNQPLRIIKTCTIRQLGSYNIDTETIVKAIEKGPVKISFTDEDLKYYEGTLKFENREPSDEEKKQRAKRIKEQEEKDRKRKPFFIVGWILAILIALYFFL